MSVWLKSKFDIGVTNVGTDGSGTALVGMMLARKNGVPIWQELDGKNLVDQFYTGVPDQVFTDPEREIILIQSDWRKGFGQYVMDDSKRYFASYGMDLSQKGQGIAGWNSSSATLPTLFSITDGGLEVWTSSTALTNWPNTGVGYALTQESGTVESGTYSAKITLSGTATSRGFDQTAANWNNAFRGKSVIMSASLKASDSGLVRLGIEDSATTTYGSWNAAGTASWQKLAAVHVLSSTTTYVKFKVDIVPGQLAGTIWVDNIVIPALGVHGKKWAEFNNDIFFSSDNAVLKVNNSTGVITYEGGVPNTVTSLAPFQVSGADYLFIACGTADAYWYADTALTFVKSTAATATYQFFAGVNTTVDTMYGNDSVNTIRSTPNPLNAGSAWSGQTVVGEAQYPITNLIEKDGALYIMKEDMPYYLNSSGQVQKDLAPELKAAASATSGKNAHIWKGELFINAGAQALLRIGTANEFIQPAKYSTKLPDFSGAVQALASDEEWLFASVQNKSDTTKIEILKGREETIDGATSWVWHPFHELSIASCEAMFASSIYKKRLWIASASTADNLTYHPLPTQYGDLTTDSNRNFKTGTYFETGYLHGNFRGTKKAYIKMDMEMGHAYSSGVAFSADYKKLGDTSWTSIGLFDGTASDRTDTKFIPADSTSVNPISTMMDFKITSVTASTALTPQLLSYKVSAVLYPSITKIFMCKVLVAEEMTLRDGTLDKGRATIITTLDNLRTATWPVSIRDINGDTFTVKYLPLPSNIPRYEIIRDERGREKEKHYNLMLMVKPLS